MTNRKRNKEAFYNDLKSINPEIESLRVWGEYEKEGRGLVESKIMIDLAAKVIDWAIANEMGVLIKLFDFFERTYYEYEEGANSYLYTDFYPTIITLKRRDIREKLKNIMGPRSLHLYEQLIALGFYAES